MNKIIRLLVLILFSSNIIFLTGCNPHSSIIISNSESLIKINELVKDRLIRVTTKDSIYIGNNIIINRDTTIVEKYTTNPRVIPYTSMKNISYKEGTNFLEGNIEVNNNIIKAENIHISNNDTVIKFNEILISSSVFPTKDLTKIQIRNYFSSTLNGLGIGLGIGALTGAILGTFIGHVDDVNSSGRPDGSGQGPSRLDNIMVGTIFGAIIGGIGGTFIGLGLGQWEDIYITYSYGEK